MLSIIFCILLNAVTVYLACIYNSTALGLLAVVELFFFLWGFLQLVIQCRKISLALEIPIAVVEKNEQAHIKCRVTNWGRLPVSRVQIKLKYKVDGQRKKYHIKTAGDVAGKSTTTLDLLIEAGKSGSYYFESARLTSYAPLGVLSWKKRVRIHDRFHVLPKIYNVGLLVTGAVYNFQGESDIYDSLHAGNDASEIFQIRPFRTGDKMKDIHWKLSARGEDWLVRENSQPLACAVVLFLGFAEKKKSKTDAMISAAVSISFALEAEGCPHYVTWYSRQEKDMVRVRVADEESLYLFLMSISAADMEKSNCDIRELYRTRYKGENYLKEICIDSQRRILVQGDCIAEISDKNIKQELENLELVL